MTAYTHSAPPAIVIVQIPQAPAPPTAAPMTLAAAFQAALATPAATASQQLVAQAQARVAQAQAQLRFGVTLTTAPGISNADVIQPPPAHETFGSLTNTLSVPLPIGRKSRLGVDQASAQLTAAQAQLESARLALASQVSAAYYDLLRKQALLQVARDTQATADRQLSDAQKRFHSGDVPELDVLRAQGPVATAQAGVDQAQTAVVVAQQALNALIGRPLDAPVSVADVPAPDPSAALPVTLEEARRRARENNPDVRAAEANASASRIARKVAGLSREPTVALEASDARSSDRTGFSRLDSVQAAITFPLSDGGLARAQAREADAALAGAQAQTEAARRAAEATVSAAYLNAQSSRRQIDAARKVREIAQTAYDKTARGYQAGLFPLTDVLSAQSALTQARIAETQAIYDAAVALSALDNALGVLPS